MRGESGQVPTGCRNSVSVVSRANVGVNLVEPHAEVTGAPRKCGNFEHDQLETVITDFSAVSAKQLSLGTTDMTRPCSTYVELSLS